MRHVKVARTSNINHLFIFFTFYSVFYLFIFHGGMKSNAPLPFKFGKFNEAPTHYM